MELRGGSTHPLYWPTSYPPSFVRENHSFIRLRTSCNGATLTPVAQSLRRRRLAHGPIVLKELNDYEQKWQEEEDGVQPTWRSEWDESRFLPK